MYPVKDVCPCLSVDLWVVCLSHYFSTSLIWLIGRNCKLKAWSCACQCLRTAIAREDLGAVGYHLSTSLVLKSRQCDEVMLVRKKHDTTHFHSQVPSHIPVTPYVHSSKVAEMQKIHFNGAHSVWDPSINNFYDHLKKCKIIYIYTYIIYIYVYIYIYIR